MQVTKIKTPFFEIELISSNEELLSKIQHDFAWFSSDVKFHFKMKLKLESGENLLERSDKFHFSFKSKQAQVLDCGDLRRVEYFDGALVEYDFKNELGLIHAPTTDRLHDLAIQLISSRTGKKLDQLGYHKIHACSVSLKGKVALILMPVGGGKSTLLLELLKDRELNFVSDDTPLINQKAQIAAYPFRIGKTQLPEEYPFLKEPKIKLERLGYGKKFLLGKDEIKVNVETEEISKKVLIFGVPSESESKIEIMSKFEAFYYLWREMVIGIGLPQIVEFYWSFGLLEMMKVIKIGFSRLFLAITLVRDNPCYRLFRGPDHTKNASLVKQILSEL